MLPGLVLTHRLVHVVDGYRPEVHRMRPLPGVLVPLWPSTLPAWRLSTPHPHTGRKPQLQGMPVTGPS